MPRPTTKEELLSAATAQFEAMWKRIEAVGDAAHFVFRFDRLKKEAHWQRDENLRDMLVHLYEWHQLLLNFVASNQNGDTKPFLPAPYNWKTYGEMNLAFWKKHQTTSYEEARQLLLTSHQNVIQMIESFTQDELFEKNHFNWTGTSHLGSYCISATSSHYNWAIKKVKTSRNIP